MAPQTLTAPTPDAVRSPLPDVHDLVRGAGGSYPYLSWLSQSVSDGHTDGEPVEETAFDAAIFESLLHP